MTKNVLIIIPARGGSKGIPRKNLRLLFGKPLIYYSITTALKSRYNPTVIVTTEDDEIALIANKFGAEVHKRPMSLADDKSTLDPVIYNALQFAEKSNNKKFDIIVTLQPTSPLLEIESLDSGIEKLITQELTDTVISVRDDTHLSWAIKDGKYFPNYRERVNRQYLEPSYTETGGFLITRDSIITEHNRIGENVDLIILDGGQEIDIDTFNDWNLCEYVLKRKKVLFVVAGNTTIGLGHVYNTLIIANDILDHEIEFLVTEDSELAYDIISSKNYKVTKQNEKSLIDDIRKINPAILINDLLDTTEQYMISIKNLGIHIINFEDLGAGSKLADLVINAIYPEEKKYPNHFFGEKYFILRDEFIFNHTTKIIKPIVENVLITFGGVDPSNLTLLTLDAIYDYCLQEDITIYIVTGPGYTNFKSIEKFKKIKVCKNVKNISEFMFNADIIFTSAGRTIYEVASIGTPALVLAQNDREMTHFFASQKFGFINLGLGKNLTKSQLLKQFKKNVQNYDERKQNHLLMLQQNLKLGRKKVLQLITESIKKYENTRFI